ncbi:hypothetical protein J1605_017239 [Eschrichtius robustus]|uniref:Uncharacterized protein n=1 Tax=Eschrichtius robustus TaxID=9764 RepID=A0AB34HXH3_ESCRO|nr:hypothetical protein J1605_017239 [Eschrichtius robustus]
MPWLWISDTGEASTSPKLPSQALYVRGGLQGNTDDKSTILDSSNCNEDDEVRYCGPAQRKARPRQEEPAGRPAPRPLPWEEAPTSKHSLNVQPSGSVAFHAGQIAVTTALSLPGRMSELRLQGRCVRAILISVLLVLLGCWGLPDFRQQFLQALEPEEVTAYFGPDAASEGTCPGVLLARGVSQSLQGASHPWVRDLGFSVAQLRGGQLLLSPC